MKCDIVMVSWNEAKLTEQALTSLHRHAQYPHRLIVVDNNSDADTVSFLERAAASGELGEMVLIRNRDNLGWIKGANLGLARATAPYVCLVNNDVVAGPGWLKRMIATLERRREFGLANPRGDERSENKRIASVDAYAHELAARNAGQFVELNHCTGYCVVMKREVIEKIGHLDEAYEGGYFEDVDYSRKAQQAGYLCIQCDDALVLHYQSVSFKKVSDTKQRLIERNRKLFEERWGRPRRLLILPRCPERGQLLAAARAGHILYVVQNAFVSPASLPHPHANIKWLASPVARLGGAWYFLWKAHYLRRKRRIDNAVILFDDSAIPG
jgi:GT2 family glycosyltransferase